MPANLHIRFARLLLFLWISVFVVSGAVAGEKKFTQVRAQLVFGSDDPDFTSKHAGLNEVEPELEEKLKKVFRWKHYWEKNQKQNKVAISLKEAQEEKVKLTERTVVGLTYQDDGNLKAELFVNGVQMITKIQKLPENGIMVLALPDGSENAWFVIISHPKKAGP